MSTSSITKPELLDFETVAGRQVEIPATSRERYLTGLYALNLHPAGATTGDWHDVYHWREGRGRPRTVTLGGGDELNTNAIYGDLGVYEGRDVLLAEGIEVPDGTAEVFVADHYRAILDLLYRSLDRYGRVLNLTGATSDWLDTPEQQEYLLTQATRMADRFAPDAQQALVDWIEGERQEAR